ncbi:MAG TPA: alpha/beta hydrolase domain-containing protein [Sphingobium sp.]|uniref:alpha/beta hydrolase domain-containing protein n=1 Tax=Sphingobium sp. TaxID=1912891 RepID=UPI002ED2727E
MGVERVLKMTNPACYASLVVPTVDLAAFEQTPAALMKWSQSESDAVPAEVFAVDSISNAIMTQVGAALKSGVHGGSVGRQPVACVIIGGASQTGGDAVVIQIYTEGDLILFGSIGPNGVASGRPDSDVADERCVYAVTGASHLPTRGVIDVEGSAQLGLTLEPGDNFLQVSFAPFSQAAFVNLVNWVQGSTNPRNVESTRGSTSAALK